MATYLPPTEDLPTFDTLVFSSLEDNITIANGDTRYLRFPVSQGSETISGNLTVTGTTTTANANVTGTLTSGIFAPAVINCATLNSATGTNQSVGGNLTTNNLALGNAITNGQINIGNSLTGGVIDIGKGTGGTITIANTNSVCSTAVQICSGASAFNASTCVIGKNSALSIDNNTGNVNLSTTQTTTSGTLTIANEAGSNRTIQIGRNNAITINNGATSTVAITGTTNINTGGTATSQIGNNSASSNVNLLGTVNVNVSGSQSTSIGNSTGTITMTGTTNINTSSTNSLTVGNTTGTVRLLSANTYIQQDTFPLVVGTGSLAGYYPIGYTIQATLGPANISDTTGTYSNIGSQTIPAVKGVYIISCGFTLTSSGNDTLNEKAMILSLTSGTSNVPVNSFGAWAYFDEINDSIGGGGGRRYTGTLCGTYINSAGTAATIYLNGYGNTTGSATISCDAGLSITRVG